MKQERDEVFARWAKTFAPAIGIVHGASWAVGALLIMDASLGMTDMIFHVGATQWQSLIDLLIYGLLLGVVYVALRARPHRS